MQEVTFADGHVVRDLIEGKTQSEFEQKLKAAFAKAITQKDVVKIMYDLNLNPGGACLCGSGKTLAECHMPHVPVPDCGRNEPCPCGSGKKYKKCCMVELSV